MLDALPTSLPSISKQFSEFFHISSRANTSSIFVGAIAEFLYVFAYTVVFQCRNNAGLNVSWMAVSAG
jgi:hypothetical protein